MGFMAVAAAMALPASMLIPAIGGAASTGEAPHAKPAKAPVEVTGTVHAKQSGAWTVGLAGTPNVLVANFPADQRVSGTVNVGNWPTSQHVTVDNPTVPASTIGIDPAHNGVTVTNFPQTQHTLVDNFPSTQTVAGTVGIDSAHNAVTSTSGDVTSVLQDAFTIGNGNVDSDTSRAKTVRVAVVCNNDASCSGLNVIVRATAMTTEYVLDTFQLASVSVDGDYEASRTYDVPGPSLKVFTQGATGNANVHIIVLGRSN
jgi:hypothetical protein